MYMMGVNKPLYYRFPLRSYRCFARAPHESRNIPAREAASDPNERLVTEYLAPLIWMCYHFGSLLSWQEFARHFLQMLRL